MRDDPKLRVADATRDAILQAADALQYKMDDSQRKYRKERAIRIVLAETLSPVDTVFDAVVADFTSGMERTVQHLRTHGHSEIGFIGPRKTAQYGACNVLRESFVRYMQEQGLLNKKYLLETDMDAGAARETLLEHIRAGHHLPTAIIAASEAAAAGVAGACREAGLSVPQELCIVGVQDTVVRLLRDTAFTIVRIPIAEMSKTAVQMVLQRAKEPLKGGFLPLKIMVPLTLTEQKCAVKDDVI